jgi:hypothetical protein
MWQSQPVEVTKMSLEVIRKRAGKLQRRVWWRNAREYVAAVFGTTVFGGYFFKTHELLFRITFALMIAGMVWIVVQLRRKASARSIPMEADTATSLRLYRGELERQRDALKNVWPLYLAPLVPGFIAYTIAYAARLGQPSISAAFPHPMSWTRLLVLDVVTAAIFVGLWKLNQRAARRLQGKIDELNGAH